jgi:hypothetical protein
MSQSKKRRQWSATKKLEIVFACIEMGRGNLRIAWPRRHRPDPALQLEKQFVGSAGAFFGQNGSRNDGSRKVDPKEAKIDRLRAVIAEITAEKLWLKNALGLEDHANLTAELQQRLVAEVG